MTQDVRLMAKLSPPRTECNHMRILQARQRYAAGICCAGALWAALAAATVFGDRPAPRTSSQPSPKVEVYQAWPYNAQEAARRQEATTKALCVPKETTVELGNKVQMKFVLIPAGRFMMGTAEAQTVAHWKDEALHEVVISKPFYMGLHPVTQAQWRTIMGTTAAQQREKIDGALPASQPTPVSGNDIRSFTYPKGWDLTMAGEGDDYPMYFVSWDEAAEFCRRASKKTATTVRLPTEAQWEYACQAGSKSRYFFGADDAKELDSYVWYKGNSGAKTHPVGQKKPNAFGLSDIQGNVWQWCSDWYGDYAAGPVTDPTGPGKGDGHIVRGGCWISDWGGCRSADRLRLPPDRRLNYVGFRVSLDLLSPTSAASSPAESNSRQD